MVVMAIRSGSYSTRRYRTVMTCHPEPRQGDIHHTGTAALPLRPEMDARVARTRETVMQAAMELLVEGGPGGLTVDAVVARSGVAKSTVYRHWADRDALVADVFNVCAPQMVEPDPDLPRPPELYRKPEDRWDQNNVVGQHSEVAEHLELTLRRFVEAIGHDTLDSLPGLRDVVRFSHG